MPDNVIVHVPRRFALQEWGGTETVVTQLCLQQLAKGQHPQIHTSRALAPLPAEDFRGIPVRRYQHRYPFWGLSAEDIHQLDKKGGNLLSLGLLGALLRVPHVRVFHAHVTKRMGGTVFTAARLRRKPCVVTLHGNHFDVPEAEATDVVAPQQGKFEWGKPLGLLLRSRHLLDRADAVLCVGYSEYEKAKAALPHDRVFYLPNGVHIEHFRLPDERREAMRAALGIKPDEFLFGCISRLDPQKDQRCLVQAFARLASRHPRTRLLLCGPVTNETYRQRIESDIAEAGLGERVVLHPPVAPDSEAQAAMFRALDTFVLPSRHEPFGIVVLEAWAAGRPVIASAVGGLAHLVREGQSGLLVPPSDAEALVAAMEKLLGQAGLRDHLAEEGHLLAREKYSWGSVAERLETIYQNCEVRYA